MNGLHGPPSVAAPFAGNAPNGAAPPPPPTGHLPSATRRSVHMAKRAGEGSFGMTLDQEVHATAADCPRVSYVFPNSAASRAGVRPGWSLELFNGVSCRGRRVSEIAPVFRELQTVTLVVDISTEIAPTATLPPLLGGITHSSPSAYPPQVPAPAPIMWPPQPSLPAPSPAATNMAFLAALQSGMAGPAISNAARSSAAMPAQHATMAPPQAVPVRAPSAANVQPATSLPSQSNGTNAVQLSAATAAPPRPIVTSAPPPTAVLPQPAAPPRAAAPPHTATPPQVAPAAAPAFVVAARPVTAVPPTSAPATASTTARPVTATARPAVAHATAVTGVATAAASTNPTTTAAAAASTSRAAGKKRSRPQSESSSTTAAATATTTTATTSTTEAAAGRRRGRQQRRRQSASSVASDVWDSDDAVYFYGSDLDPDVEEVSPPPAGSGRNRRTSSRQADSGGRARRSLTVSRLMTMGFTQEEAELSVENCGDDPDGCMIWIVSYREEKQFMNDLNKASIESENQKRLDAQQQKKEESETLRQATAFTSLFQTSYVLSDLASAPRLQAMLSSTIGDIAADTLMRTLLTKLLTVESKAIRWYKEACKCYMLELAARLEAAFESHDAAVCCSTTLASQPAAEGCAFVRALHEEEQALSKELFLLPENHGGVPLAFLRADKSMQFSLDDDGFEVVDQPPAPASPSQD